VKAARIESPWIDEEDVDRVMLEYDRDAFSRGEWIEFELHDGETSRPLAKFQLAEQVARSDSG